MQTHAYNILQIHLLEVLVYNLKINFIFAGITNNLLQVEVLESGSNVMLQCRLLAAITEWVHCEARYGTDPSHHVLPYRDTSNNAGLERDVLTIHISHDLQPYTTYDYNISLVAVDGIISARVLHSIRIGKEMSTCVDSLPTTEKKHHKKLNNRWCDCKYTCQKMEIVTCSYNIIGIPCNPLPSCNIIYTAFPRYT